MALTLNGSTNTIAGVAVGGLPDGIVDTDMIAAKAVVTGKITDGTITNGDLASGGLGNLGYGDQWRLTSSFDGEADPISSNWERIDANGAGNYGSAMSVSSGIWTFPATGYWYIRFDRMCSRYNAWCEWSQTMIKTSTDNFSSSDLVADHYPAMPDLGTNHNYQYTGCQYLFDVQNTSNYKCRFGVNNAGDDGSVRTYGDTNTNYSYVTFIRLGDT
jgi:hypothetical protein